MEKASYIFASIVAMVIGGAVLSLARRAVDTMDPVWIGLCIALLAVVIGGALLLDRQSGA